MLIRRTTLSSFGASEVEISSVLAEELREAREGLLVALEVEEKYDSLVGNYSEFERTLLLLALERALHGDLDWSAIQRDISLVNRRVQNFLSSFRAYLDHTDGDLKKLGIPAQDLRSSFNGQLSQRFDAEPSYRLMFDLRNFAQHRGSVIGAISYAPYRGASNTLAFTAEPKIVLAFIEGDSGAKPRLVSALKDLESPEIDIRPLIREGMKNLTQVHKVVREGLSALAEPWVKKIKDALEQFRMETGKDEKVLKVVKWSETGEELERFQVFSYLFERKAELERRNPVDALVGTVYASGQCE